MFQNALATLLLGAGVFFLLVGAVGFIRLPDVFCRLHVTGIVDTLGAPLILLGAAVYLCPRILAGKLLLGIVFIALTSPLVGHMLARAALEAGYRPRAIENPAAVEARYGKRGVSSTTTAEGEP
ncbi:MAG: monovalent cation/H(+) antiporter subunit G [Myxococcota bacterium]|nr:monovalent cation/H(+) antiporter subunit G [Myxococcota bacterium]